jgi:uncharacterized membrane protein YbhN (UPF0104 family)
MGIPASWELLVLASFAMGTATLVGSVLLLPGGLGATEGSIEGLLVFFGQHPWLPVGVISTTVGTAATLLIRFATLWFGVALGFIALAIAQMRFGRLIVPDATGPATPDAEREVVGASR